MGLPKVGLPKVGLSKVGLPEQQPEQLKQALKKLWPPNFRGTLRLCVAVV